MTTLYTNGCSYTANNLVEQQLRYPALVSKHFGWQLLDRSNPGACNDRIIRCTMRDIMQLIAKSQSTVVLLQLTHLARTEYPGRATPNTAWKHWNDPGFESIKPYEKDLDRDVDAYMKLHCCLFDHQAYMIKLMCSLVGLTSFLKQHNVSYLIFAGPMELNQFEPESFYGYLEHDTGVLNLRDFNMLHLTGSHGHPTEEGMRAIADYFIKVLTPRKL